MSDLPLEEDTNLSNRNNLHDRSLFPELTDTELAEARLARHAASVSTITNGNEIPIDDRMKELMENHLKLLNDQPDLLTEEEAAQMAANMMEDMQKIDPIAAEERKCQMCGRSTLRGLPPRTCSRICDKALEEMNSS